MRRRGLEFHKPPTKPAAIRLLTEDDLAERWQVSVKTIQKMRSYGRGPDYVPIGRQIRYRLSAVRAFERRTAVPGNQPSSRRRKSAMSSPAYL